MLSNRAYRAWPFSFVVFVAIVISGCGGGGGGGGNELSPHPINRPPTLVITEPSYNPYSLDVRQAATCEIKFRADDPDGGELEYAWTWDAGSVQPAEGTVAAGTETTVRFTPPNYNGRCTLGLTVSDGEANASKNLIVDVSGVGVEPGTQLRILGMNMSPDPVAPSATANLSATVDNPGGKALTYTWRCKYGKISTAGDTAVWRAPDTPGIYSIYLAVSNGTASVSAGRAATVAGPTGGLLGQYFNTHREKGVVYFDDMVLSRVDPTVNFNWAKLSPAPDKLPGDGFGGRWTGFFKGEAPGTYTFRAFADDGARMKIKDDTGLWVEAIPNNSENWNDHTEGAYLPAEPIPVQLQGGKWYPIELEYFEGDGDAFIDLYWSVNGSPEAIIPQESLKPPE